MAIGWNRPQEDEFALCGLGAGSQMLDLMFPNEPRYGAYLSLDELPPLKIARWKATLVRFLTGITLIRPRRIILKSPQHTSRIAHLIELFPDAQFIYLVREPKAVIPSTIRLWQIMASTQGLQVPRHEGLQQRVIDTFCQMHDTVERTRHLVPPDNFYQIRYEDLVANPIEEMQRIYEYFGWSQFENVLPGMHHYLAETADFRPNRHHLPPELRESIERRCASFRRQYGYAEPAVAMT
jgi:hypothetical protein